MRNSTIYSSPLSFPPKRRPFEDSYQAVYAVCGEIQALWVIHLIRWHTTEIAG